MEIKGWTLEELANELGMSKNSTAARIKLKNITPLFNGSIYPVDTLEQIKGIKPGRPKKPDPEPPNEAGEP